MGPCRISSRQKTKGRAEVDGVQEAVVQATRKDGQKKEGIPMVAIAVSSDLNLYNRETR